MAVGRTANDAATQAEIDRLREDALAMGFSSESIEREVGLIVASREVVPGAFPVHPANRCAGRLFEAMATQWNIVGLSTMDRAGLRQTGLRYEVLEPTARLIGLEVTSDLFARIRIMEAEALNAFSESWT